MLGPDHLGVVAIVVNPGFVALRKGWHGGLRDDFEIALSRQGGRRGVAIVQM